MTTATTEATTTEPMPEASTTPLMPAPMPPLGKAAQLTAIDESAFQNLLDTARFEHLWRVAQVFARTKMVPQHFQGHPEDCFVALQMAIRLQVDPLMFLQKTYVVSGKPGMEAQMAIALVNARGPFDGPIQYHLHGSGDGRACTAYAVHRRTRERCEATVDVRMAKAEGWYARNPKWKNMTDLMLQYRSASFLARLYAPETLMGMMTDHELEDMDVRRVDSVARPPLRERLAEAFGETEEAKPEPPPVEDQPDAEPPVIPDAVEALAIQLHDMHDCGETAAMEALGAFAQKFYQKSLAELDPKEIKDLAGHVRNGSITPGQ